MKITDTRWWKQENDEAVGFGRYGENLGFHSSCVISEMARNWIRRTEKVTEFAYRKIESLRARTSAVDSIIHKIDGAGEKRIMVLRLHTGLGMRKPENKFQKLSKKVI